jgi:hypothetical protein
VSLCRQRPEILIWRYGNGALEFANRRIILWGGGPNNSEALLSGRRGRTDQARVGDRQRSYGGAEPPSTRTRRSVEFATCPLDRLYDGWLIAATMDPEQPVSDWPDPTRTDLPRGLAWTTPLAALARQSEYIMREVLRERRGKASWQPPAAE